MLSLLPPRRLGALLGQARSNNGLSYDQVVGICGTRFSVLELQGIEMGARTIGDDDVRVLASIYRLAVSQLVPQRSQLHIDRTEGRLLAGDTAGRFAPDGDDREIMMRYLSIVYALRGLKPGRFFVPRIADLVVLGRVFDATPASVRRDLEWLMRSARREIAASGDQMGRRAAIPAIGILVALTSIGGLLMVGSASASDATPRIGNAIVIQRTTDPVTGARLSWPVDRDDPRLVLSA